MLEWRCVRQQMDAHTLGLKAHVIPEIVVRRLALRHLIVRLRLDSMDKVGKLDTVLDEEDRDIVANNIPVPLRGVKFGRKPAHIANRLLKKKSHVSRGHYAKTGLLTALPRDPCTVLNRTKVGVIRDGSVKTPA